MLNYSVSFADEAAAVRLGGDLHAPECTGPDSWRWLGEHKAWVLLPDEFRGRTVSVAVVAAPLILHEAPLMEISLSAAGRKLGSRAVPRPGTASMALDVQLGRCPDGALIQASWRELPPPTLCIGGGGRELLELTFEPVPHFQERRGTVEVVGDGSGSNEPAAAYFSPVYALDEPGEQGRRLSFRLKSAVFSAP